MNLVDRTAVRNREPDLGDYRQFFQAVLHRLRTGEKLFHYTWIVLLIKSFIFLGLVNNDGVHFNIIKAFQLMTNPLFVLIYISFEVALLSVSFLSRGKLHYWMLVFLNLLLSFVMVADLMNFRAFGSFFSVYALLQTSNLDNLAASIISMLRPVDVVFGIDIILLVLTGFWAAPEFKSALRSFPIFFMLLVLSTGVIFLNYLVIDVFPINSNFFLFKCSWSQNQTMSNLSPLGYHLFDAYEYFEESRPLSLSDEERGQIKAWFASKSENLPKNSFSGLFQGKNLIVLQVESLENFVIGKSENGQEITPNLNKLLANSFYFSNYYEQVWNGTSSDADLMTNTSVYPVRQGSTFFRFPGNTYNSLPKILQNHGYETLAIHPDKGGYWNWRPALTAIGFQNTIDESYFQIDEWIGLGISDGSYLRQVEEVIKKEKQPFYTFLVTLSSHAPFDLPAQYCSLDLNPDLNISRLGGYFQSIHYTDQQIGEFINKLDKDGLLENTVIALYGDHTGVHKFYDDEIRGLKNPESWWLEGYNQIPLIIYSKGMQGKEVKTTGGQIDLLPTLAYLMGIDQKEIESTAMGRNLLNTHKDYVVLSTGQLLGRGLSDQESKDAVQGLDIADKIIRSNYFKTYKDNDD
ncbi:phosphoglycerol transferase family protein, alkaline phosphatase superfamily [Desulfosporosinus orientis DSM 765]|uniref:Phosphoglycerol transferase family protein, alkaline phosphatase superfamily n=1 Tax=Desulfosporosinus orientis (strain ATCC 19365 / DSM 765 / NCIMB 8382 / VKM B-1628 / Singapore I) TaxID=768706 RepID=G7WJI5_DESOD|nr:LTA synthase family protein [Desulfosporosinus orientis]AET70422.1 phosphoglycerol transferase family protein, alkaline phosphatase superfamily [Desulfosporosinus orientis DSM 765]